MQYTDIQTSVGFAKGNTLILKQPKNGLFIY